MLGVMGVLKSFTDELRKVQAEREAQLFLEVLRRRLGDLTFGDLTALLISPLGKKLAALKVSESFTAAPASAGAPASAAAPVAEKTSSKKSSLAKAKAAKPPKAREPKATKPTKAVKATKPTKAVKAPKPTKPVKATKPTKAVKAPKTAQAPKAPKTTAVNKTTKAPASVKPATTLSSAAEGHKVAAPAPLTPPQASATGPRKGSAPSEESRIAFDQSIVAALHEAGDWTAATELRAKVGGTRDQIWLGLRRLTAEGMITRIGEREATRYKLVG
jgi:outer membrane biosynthesis protein TonB